MFNHAIALNPNDQGSYEGKAFVQNELGDLDAAIETWSQAIRAGDWRDCHAVRSSAYLKAGRLREAIGDFSWSIQNGYDARGRMAVPGRRTRLGMPQRSGPRLHPGGCGATGRCRLSNPSSPERSADAAQRGQRDAGPTRTNEVTPQPDNAIDATRGTPLPQQTWGMFVGRTSGFAMFLGVALRQIVACSLRSHVGSGPVYAETSDLRTFAALSQAFGTCKVRGFASR